MYTYTNGDFFLCDYTADKKHGTMSYHFASKDTITVSFDHNMPVGVARYTGTDGATCEVDWAFPTKSARYNAHLCRQAARAILAKPTGTYVYCIPSMLLAAVIGQCH